jgi:hypothetical protein
MNRRLRILAALFALFALTAYFAESVAASWCMPSMQSAHSEASADSQADPHGGLHHGHTPGEPSEGSHCPHSEAPVCPVGMMGAGASCVAALLPATAETMRLAGPTYETSPLGSNQTHDRLLVTAHFRPPRA